MNKRTGQFPLKAPVGHGETLFVPGLDGMEEEIAANVRDFAEEETCILNRSLAHWRRRCRTELMGRAEDYSTGLSLGRPQFNPQAPLIVTGHQPQLYHCGVLIKYLLAGYLARARHTIALNLIVDSDLPKNLAFNVPVQTQAGSGMWQVVPDGIASRIPMECQPPVTLDRIDSVIRELQGSAAPLFLRERLKEIIQGLRAAQSGAENLSQFYTLMNRGFAGTLEDGWAELPVSLMAQSEGFRAFVADMLLQAPDAHRYYNNALDAFRRDNKTRSGFQPLPNLARGGEDVLEMPFWVFAPHPPSTGTATSRRPLYGRFDASGIIFSGGVADFASCPADPGELLRHLGGNAWALRPRALTLSIFARLFLADYFLHGIGGARYDQVSDRFIAQFYRMAPPRFAAVTATMHLPLNALSTVAELKSQLRKVRQQRRDLRYNPQRYLSAEEQNVGMTHIVQQRRKQIEIGKRLRQTHGPSPARREAFEAIHRFNGQINAALGHLAQDFERKEQTLLYQLPQARLAQNREFFFALFSLEQLKILQTPFAESNVTG